MQHLKIQRGFCYSSLGYISRLAANQGFHKGDSVLVVSDSVFKKKQLDFAHSQLDSLQDYPVKAFQQQYN
jgi:hypothetical protein